MIQDIKPHHFTNHYQPRKPKKGDIVFIFRDQDTYLKNDQSFYRFEEVSSTKDPYYLFEIDALSFYLMDEIPTNSNKMNLFEVRHYQDEMLRFACVSAWHLYQWIQKNQYCGHCGHTLEHSSHERVFVCPSCHQAYYPRLNPAVIVGVLNQKDQLLVTRYRKRRYTHHALVAGYAEFGETIEECVKREVKEETGLTVTNLRYVNSQPWGFSESLLFGFWCDVTGSDEISLDQDELTIAEWKNAEDEFDILDYVSLTAEMIRLFKQKEVHYGE